MKKIFFLLLALNSIMASAQDTLILLDETAIGVKILRETDNEYHYYLWNDQNQYQRAINKKFIKNIKMRDMNPGQSATDQTTPHQSDRIVYRNGAEMKVEVVDVGKENIIYREEGKEVNYVIPIAQVERIDYADGQKLEFNSANVNLQSKLPSTSEKSSVSDPITGSETIGGDIDKNRLVGFVFGGKLGYFIPFNDGLTQIYGAGFSYGLEVGWWGRNGFGWNLEFREFAKRGKVTYEGDYSSTKYNFMSLTTSFNYAFVEKGKFKTYAGLGLGAAFISFSDTSESLEYTIFDYFFYGGIYFKPMYIEARFVNAPWEKTNMGGFELCFGIIF